MNIVVIRTTSAVSGAEIHTQWLLNGLRTYHGIESELLTDYAPFAQLISSEGIRTHRFPFHIPEIGTKRSFVLGSLTGIPFAFWTAALLARPGDKPLVVLESMTEKLLMTRWLSQMGFPTVWIEHGPLFRTNRWDSVKRWYRETSVSVDGILAVSEDTKVDLLSGGVEPKRIRAIPIGIYESYIVDKPEYGRTPTVGYVGGVNEAKGIRVFTEAVQMMALGRKDTRFLVVGNGPQSGWLTAEIARLHLTDRFTVIAKPVSYLEAIDQCDVVLFPTMHQEGLSIAMLQSAARGRAIVARDIGGNRELTDGKTGILLPLASDAGQFAGTAAKLIAEPGMKRKLGTAAAALARKRYGLKMQTGKIAEFFRSVWQANRA
jgi:glycosyltransferase involved in cell wall biosynthesis